MSDEMVAVDTVMVAVDTVLSLSLAPAAHCFARKFIDFLSTCSLMVVRYSKHLS